MRALGLSILGATGSIGRSTLDVVARHPERFRIVALTAHGDAEALFRLCQEHRPEFAVIVKTEAAADLERRLHAAGLETRLLTGRRALVEVAGLPEADCVMAAIVGAAGLEPTLAAARAGKRLLLANKEALVMAGALFMEAVRAAGATLIPIDSEHNAVFQCLPGGYRPGRAPAGVKRILLTASGGPFRDRPLDSLDSVTPEEACAHPNWVMGRKISVDSATMMNKGLEVIEAHWLFGLPGQAIEVVLHPQSVVHSLVEYEDGSMLAQLGNPDMRTPIAHALGHPERLASGVAPLDLAAVGRLEFQVPDPGRYPCLRLAFEALEAGGAMPAVLNAANEVAVAGFLAGRRRFTDIAGLNARALERFAGSRAAGLEDLIALDGEVRAWAEAA